MDFLLFVVQLLFLIKLSRADPFTYLGCYAKGSSSVTSLEPRVNASTITDLWFRPILEQSPDMGPRPCISACALQSFRYAGVSAAGGGDRCGCGGQYGSTGSGQCHPCHLDRPFDPEHCGDEGSWSIYDTNFKVPSRPEKVALVQRGENTLKISWMKPRSSNGPLISYQVSAQGVNTYAQNPNALQLKSWRVSDLEEELILTGLTPATKFNVSVVAINSEGSSTPISALFWSKIGVPDSPPPPAILSSGPKRMTIEIRALENTNGPLSKYRIVMVDESRLYQTRFFSMDRVVTWNDSVATGYPKYVAAQFSPEHFPNNGKFEIGNGVVYDGFYNGPIPEGHWHPSLGIVSTLENDTEIAYSSTSHDQHSNNEDILMPSSTQSSVRRGLKGKKTQAIEVSLTTNEVVATREMSPMVVALWISIATAALILLLCVAIYSVLKYELLPKHRRRPPLMPDFSRPMQTERPTELAMCGSNPAYIFPDDFSGGYTHSGFIPDLDLKSRALDCLKHVWNVPRHLIGLPEEEEEGVTLLGKGRYGPVHSTKLKAKDTVTPVATYTIPGTFLKNQDPTEGGAREQFLVELENLVRIEPHENVLKLVGFLEDGPSLLLTLELGSMTLKEWLLDFRTSDVSVKMSPVASYNLLLCAMNIAEALFHLHSFNITHGELAAINVVLPSIDVPRVTGFGLLKCDPIKGRRDFSRWLSAEQFQNRCIKPCDAWSFGILLWEIASLGATPYYDVRKEDLQKRLSRGHRPCQLEVIGDPLYQIMLNCWQIDRTERPDFATLSCSIHQLLPKAQESLCISPSFNYPPQIQAFEYTA